MEYSSTGGRISRDGDEHTKIQTKLTQLHYKILKKRSDSSSLSNNELACVLNPQQKYWFLEACFSKKLLKKADTSNETEELEIIIVRQRESRETNIFRLESFEIW